MNKVRILNAEPHGYSERAKAVLRQVGELREQELSQQDLPAALADVHVLICRLGLKIDRSVLEAAPVLGAVASATTGLDHIDVEAAEARGIAVLSLRGEREFLRAIPATSEHTWALLLALLRQVPSAVASVRMGVWERDLFRGRDLAGKTLGIVGLGRIGEKVAAYGRAFDMHVTAYETAPGRDMRGVTRMEDLATLLSVSDVVSLHVPLSDETEKLIGEEELRHIKPGAVLINTSRGRVLDEDALLAALESGRLAGAALDVVATEQSGDVFASPLFRYARSHENLLITPHIGGATHDSMERTEIFMAEKIAAFVTRES